MTPCTPIVATSPGRQWPERVSNETSWTVKLPLFPAADRVRSKRRTHHPTVPRRRKCRAARNGGGATRRAPLQHATRVAVPAHRPWPTVMHAAPRAHALGGTPRVLVVRRRTRGRDRGRSKEKGCVHHACKSAGGLLLRTAPTPTAHVSVESQERAMPAGATRLPPPATPSPGSGCCQTGREAGVGLRPATMAPRTVGAGGPGAGGRSRREGCWRRSDLKTTPQGATCTMSEASSEGAEPDDGHVGAPRARGGPIQCASAAAAGGECGGLTVPALPSVARGADDGASETTDLVSGTDDPDEYRWKQEAFVGKGARAGVEDMRCGPAPQAVPRGAPAPLGAAHGRCANTNGGGGQVHVPAAIRQAQLADHFAHVPGAHRGANRHPLPGANARTAGLRAPASGRRVQRARGVAAQAPPPLPALLGVPHELQGPSPPAAVKRCRRGLGEGGCRGLAPHTLRPPPSRAQGCAGASVPCLPAPGGACPHAATPSISAPARLRTALQGPRRLLQDAARPRVRAPHPACASHPPWSRAAPGY